MAAPSSTRGPALTFTTLAAPVARRTELWREYCREHLPGYRCSPLGNDDIRITVRHTDIGDTRIVEVAGDGNLCERTSGLIAGTPDPTIIVGILVSGNAWMQHGAAIDVLGAGDAVVYDPARPVSYGRSDGFEEVVLVLPRDALDLGDGANGTIAPFVVRRDPIDVLAWTRELCDALHEEGPDDARVSAAVERVLGALLHRDRSSAHWFAAHAYIRERSADPLLSVGAVARAVGLSERQLARVFAERHSTVRAAIIDERMRRAHELVVAPDAGAMPIAHIARSIGFVSPSHFARAFRQSYGMSATAARAAASSAG